ncbi:MAG: SagB/ThcOx family dehydrogenase [Planctomycetes bacterium]|nr:SagB/ThcOx family dehydrogenase [Planctomycetota bacterium]MBL7039924.1 SagB/ThcOx family dehydrogenase [Pirellulaceae bacterium]
MTRDAIGRVLQYHDRTKHHLNRYARSLGYMDWATQPDPFRRFDGAPKLALDHPALSEQPSYDSLFEPNSVEPEPVDRQSVSRLFYDSLALSAWKQAPGTKPWSLRISPSSGALYPTEGYLVAGPVDQLSTQAAVYHYSPYDHALEQRIELTVDEWNELAAQLPAGCVLLALTSIYWRESWKYGERAFRYCNHDVGHAIGAIALSAAMLGWRTRMVGTVTDEQISVLLGVHQQEGMEAEHPDCLLAVYPRDDTRERQSVDLRLTVAMVERLRAAEFAGTPNRLSPDHHPWPLIDEVSQATRREAPTVQLGNDDALSGEARTQPIVTTFQDRNLSAQQIIRQRRSAVDMDGRTTMDRDVFYRLLTRLTPCDQPPFDVLPWRPRVSLALFVHRVEGISPGLYVLIRHPSHERSLRDNFKQEFVWEEPPGCPGSLNLRLLMEADCRQAAEAISCGQSIASAGVFSLGMLAEFNSSIEEQGAWFYPRLFWETGLVGQVLYLEAEVTGLRGTGIGCFLDDAMHDILGIQGADWQSLYHFTVGGPVEDPRLKTIPPYAHLEARH